MKTTLILLFLSLLLISCEKKTRFICTQVTTTQKKYSTCGPTYLSIENGFNLTYDEKWDFEHDLTYSMWAMAGKDSIYIVNTFHCVPCVNPQ